MFEVRDMHDADSVEMRNQRILFSQNQPAADSDRGTSRSRVSGSLLSGARPWTLVTFLCALLQGAILASILSGAEILSSPANANIQDGNSKQLSTLDFLTNQTLFESGTNETHTFRIPAIITSLNGDLIAACDARRTSAADLLPQRNIDIVFRRSQDNGETWSEINVLEPFDDAGCSDPSLLLDRSTGDLFCFYNYMTSDLNDKEFRFLFQKSSDNGITWQAPVDVTDQIASNEPENSFKFVTSGRGIQTRDGMLVHNFVRVGKGATVFASRDHGATWQPLGQVSPADETKVVELPDRTLMLNSRNLPGKRYVHTSTDLGLTWTSTAFELSDPRCNASIIQYTAEVDGYAKDRLLFCNAASNTQRTNLTVRLSYDNGASWRHSKVIDSGPSAYSELTILRDGSIGVLYEPGNTEIRFARFTLEALSGGADRLSKPWRPLN